VVVSPPFTDREIGFLTALVEEGVEFIVVGLAAAALQGAPAVTQDIDLWVKDRSAPAFRKALRRVGASYIPPTENNPPLLVGGGADLFDLVVHMHGLDSFRQEVGRVIQVSIGPVEIPVLPLERIIASKAAIARPKDLAILPVLRDTLHTLRNRSERDD